MCLLACVYEYCLFSATLLHFHFNKQLHLYVSSEWLQRHQLSADEMYRLCSSVQCCAEGTETPFSCLQCKAQSLITFGVASPQTFAAERVADSVERFTFDSCRTNCSSSR